MARVKQDWEYEKTVDTVSVQGNLTENVKFWEVLQAPSYTVDVIQSGYVMPFTSLPTKFCKSNQRTALANAQFVEQAIDQLLDDGWVREVNEQPWVCSPLSVVEGSMDKKRLVLDLRHVNMYLHKQKFKG